MNPAIPNDTDDFPLPSFFSRQTLPDSGNAKMPEHVFDRTVVLSGLVQKQEISEAIPFNVNFGAIFQGPTWRLWWAFEINRAAIEACFQIVPPTLV